MKKRINLRGKLLPGLAVMAALSAGQFAGAQTQDGAGAADQVQAQAETIIFGMQIIEDGAPRVMAEFHLSDLQDLPATTIRTQTVWTDGVQQFTGVELADLVAHLGLSGGMLEAVAINDYLIEIPLTDAVAGGPIIAYLRNGEPMSVRDKGPLWVVYPYDDNPDYQREEIYARSIWQLTHMIHHP